MSILNCIFNESKEHRAGHDGMDTLGEALDMKPELVRKLWFEEARFDDERRSEHYEEFGSERLEAELEAEIIKKFESGRDE